jgi:hypothetical protein
VGAGGSGGVNPGDFGQNGGNTTVSVNSVMRVIADGGQAGSSAPGNGGPWGLNSPAQGISAVNGLTAAAGTSSGLGAGGENIYGSGGDGDDGDSGFAGYVQVTFVP